MEIYVVYKMRGKIVIRRCQTSDTKEIFEIINDASQAYKGVIPADCWKEPYMPMAELEHEIEQGVVFWGHEEDGKLLGVMGSSR
jgi:hypothetical protein